MQTKITITTKNKQSFVWDAIKDSLEIDEILEEKALNVDEEEKEDIDNKITKFYGSLKIDKIDYVEHIVLNTNDIEVVLFNQKIFVQLEYERLHTMHYNFHENKRGEVVSYEEIFEDLINDDLGYYWCDGLSVNDAKKIMYALENYNPKYEYIKKYDIYEIDTLLFKFFQNGVDFYEIDRDVTTEFKYVEYRNYEEFIEDVLFYFKLAENTLKEFEDMILKKDIKNKFFNN